MKGSRVASRYAAALLELSIEQNTVEVIRKDMDQLLSICKNSRDFLAMLKSPVINPHKKNDLYERIFGASMHKLSLAFMKLITKNAREKFLPEIATSFVSQHKTYKNIVEVYVTSATTLDTGAKEKILAKVRQSIKGTLEVYEEVDEKLIGGFVVRIDDMQIDASIRNQLKNLNQILLN